MKKLLLVITLFSFVFWFTGCEKETLKSQDDIEILKKSDATANTFDKYGKLIEGCAQMEIWAGVGNNDAGYLIGHAIFYPYSEPNLEHEGKIVIDLDYGWMAEEVQVHFGDGLGDFPLTKKKKNPKVGKFGYKVTCDPPTDNIVIENVFFKTHGAIHISAVNPYCEEKQGIHALFDWYLVNDVYMTAVYNKKTAFFTVEILDGFADGDINPATPEVEYEGGPLAGTYTNVFCVAPVVPLRTYINPKLVKIFDSYDEGLFDFFDDPNVDFDYGNAKGSIFKTNWFINHYQVGDMIQPIDEYGNSEGVEVEISWIDYQYAIWNLTSGYDKKYWGESSYNESVIYALIGAVNSNIEEASMFVPKCGDNRIIVLVAPAVNNSGFKVYQPLITWFPVPCSCEETAWGDGKVGATFGSQWGTWFNMNFDEVCQLPLSKKSNFSTIYTK